MIEYRRQSKAIAVDAARSVVRFEFQDEVRADLFNVRWAMRAAAIAVQSGLAKANARRYRVDSKTFRSTAARGVHVLADSIRVAPLMRKSGPIHIARVHRYHTTEQTSRTVPGVLSEAATEQEARYAPGSSCTACGDRLARAPQER